MSWVIQKDPNLPEMVHSTYKGCLWIDLKNKKAWYATRQANPTIFARKVDAEQWVEILKNQFPESEFVIAVNEELFQEKIIPSPVISDQVSPKIVMQDWNWDPCPIDDDIPF